MRFACAQRFEVEPRQHLVDTPGDLGRGQGEVLETERQILFDGRPDELVVGVLKQHADVATHVEVAVVAAEVVPADLGTGRARRTGEPTQKASERRLARAVGADHGHELALLDGQVDVAQGVVGGAGVPVPQSPDLDQRHAATPLAGRLCDRRTCPKTAKGRGRLRRPRPHTSVGGAARRARPARGMPSRMRRPGAAPA